MNWQVRSARMNKGKWTEYFIFFYLSTINTNKDKWNIISGHGVCTKNKWNDNIRPKGMKVLGQLE